MNSRARYHWLALALGAPAAATSVMAGHQITQAQIAISTMQHMSFGSFSVLGAGTVTMTPAGLRVPSNFIIPSSIGSGRAAQFSVSGDPLATYDISLPANGTVVLTSGGGYTMALNDFTSTPSGSGTLGAGGTETLLVGATLTVAGDQPTGEYSGSFQLIVNYN